MSETNLEPLPPPVPKRYRNRADTFLQDAAPPQAKPPQVNRWRWRWFHRSDSRPESSNGDDRGLGIETTDQENAPSLKQQSKSWGTSLVVHALLLLLVTYLVAPADLGRNGARVIRLRLGDVQTSEQQSSAPVEISLPVAEPTALPSEAIDSHSKETDLAIEESEVVPEVADASVDSGASAANSIPSKMASTESLDSLASTSDKADNSGKAPVEAAQPRGTFFGVSAEGYDFVYILDRSTSMQGSRFERAKKELIRSVRSLRKDQNFYVFLFGKKTEHLFGNYSPRPQCVPASDDNKKELEEWLGKRRASGNTDPRTALYLAFEMDPSAIFMLSDGEFTDDKSNALMKPYLRRTTFKLVSALVRDLSSIPPIHAIAYEDPKSRKNMEQLATMTGGTSVFVRYKPPNSQQLLEDARKAFAQSIGEKRNQQLMSLSFEFAKPSTSIRARRQFAKMLESDAKKSLELIPLEPGMKHLDLAFARLLQLDQTRLSDDEHQQRCAQLMDRIVEHWQQQSGDQLIDRLSTMHQALKQVDNRSYAQEILGEALFERATELDDQGNSMDAYSLYRRIGFRHPRTKQADESLARCREIEHEIQQQIQDTVGKGAIAEAIQNVRQKRSTSNLPEERLLWQNTLTEIVFATLAKQRDAVSERDFVEAKLTEKELENGLETSTELKDFRQRFEKQEVLARKQLGLTIRSQRRLHPNAREQQLRRIVQAYPHTLAAQQAARYLPDEP